MPKNDNPYGVPDDQWSSSSLNKSFNSGLNGGLYPVGNSSSYDSSNGLDAYNQGKNLRDSMKIYDHFRNNKDSFDPFK